MTLQKQAEICLDKYPATRNSDIKLTNAIWIEFYQSKLCQLGDKWAVELLTLYELPSQDDVKRVRAKIQNHKTNPRYVPTDPDVCRKRHIREEVWRAQLGYNPELRTI